MAENVNQGCTGNESHLKKILANADLKIYQGEFSQALYLYRKIRQHGVNHLNVSLNIARCLHEMRQYEAALLEYKQCLKVSRNNPMVLANCSATLIELRNYVDAATLCRTALKADPKYSLAANNLIRALALAKLDEQVIDAGESYFELIESNIVSIERLTLALRNSGQESRALKLVEELVKKNQENKDLLLHYGVLLNEVGENDKAKNIFKSLLERYPEDISNFLEYVRAEKISPDTPYIKNAKAIEKKLPNLNLEMRIMAEYALGKFFVDLCELERGFTHYSQGAVLKRLVTHCDLSSIEAEHRNIQRITKKMMAHLNGDEYESDVPILIIGMPRSGTTLIEQIISSHPAVFGAGEVTDLGKALQGLSSQDRSVRIMGPNRNDSSLIFKSGRIAAKQYVDALEQRAGKGYHHVTDKLPKNYQYAGLVAKILPNAKIIHCRRDPIDTCLSCWTHLFASGQEWTYDFHELAFYYRQYWETMQYWRELIPGRFYEVRYEETVADLEGTTRGLLNYCDLQWDDSCLKYYKNNRPVRTASVTQVRNPIYSTSVQQWRRYEKFLYPLIESLQDISDEYYTSLPQMK